MIEDLTGVDDAVIDVRELGGRWGSDELWIPGAPQFLPGAEVVVMLERGPGGWRTVALSFSAFSVVNAGPLASGVQRFVSNADVVDEPAESRRTRTLDELRRVVSAIKGVAPVRPSAQARAEPDRGGSVSEPFTLLGGGMRWRQADSGTSVFWYRNADRPHPLTSGDVDAEIATSLAAWTNPATASLILAHGGTRSASGSTDVFCTSVTAGLGLISFEDPEGDIQSGVLAIGGGCASGPITTVNGQNFSSFSHGFVVFNDAASLGSSYKVAPNFTRVLTHEIGHGIGLGHPCGGSGPSCTTALQANVMYPSCCYSTMPLPPNIGPDDLAGLEFIYPQGSTPPPPPPPRRRRARSPRARRAASYGPGGGSASIAVTASGSSCAWTATSGASWITITSGASGTGTGNVGYAVDPNAGSARTGTFTAAGRTVTISQNGDTDTDGDGMPDSWEVTFGLDPKLGRRTQRRDRRPRRGRPDEPRRVPSQPARTRAGSSRAISPKGAVNAFFQTGSRCSTRAPDGPRSLRPHPARGAGRARRMVLTVPRAAPAHADSSSTLSGLATAPTSRPSSNPTGRSWSIGR